MILDRDETPTVAEKSSSAVSVPVIKRKRPAYAPNPLSNRPPQSNSKSQEKKKTKKFRGK